MKPHGSKSEKAIHAPRWTVAVFAFIVATGLCEHGYADWPLARGNAQSTAAASGQLPSELSLLWELPLGGIGFDGTPVIADKVVYLADGGGRVVAISLVEGTLKWERKLETSFAAPASVQGDMVFIGDMDGKLHALKTTDGADIWTFETEGQIDAGATFHGDNVLITSEDGVLYCLKKSDGGLNWKYETGDQLRCGATLADDRTFLGGCDGKLHIVDVTNGTGVGEPAPLDGPTGSTPAVSEGLAVVPTHSGALIAIQTASGKEAWRFRNVKFAQEFQNSVAIADGLVIASSHNRRVFALDLKDGSDRWDTTLRKRCDSSPVVVGDKVALAATDGRIILLDLKSGRELWVTEVKGSFIASPAVSDNRLVVASDKGTVYCFGTK